MSPAAQVTPQQQAQRLSVAYNNLGGILKMQGRATEAISCYEHVARLQVPLLLTWVSGSSTSPFHVLVALCSFACALMTMSTGKLQT